MTEQELEDFEEGISPARYDAYSVLAMAGVPPRTLHYYVQRRLIPHAIGAGPAARYTYEHVVRLKVLRILKGRRMTLRQIRVILDGSTVRELHRIAEGRNPERTIDNVRRALHSPQGERPHGSEPFFRLTITAGVQLLVSPEHHARAAVRLQELTEAFRHILGIEPPP